MSDTVVVNEQKALLKSEIESAEEIKEHVIKAMSVLDLVVASLEKKEEASKDLDIASELNAIVSVYDNLDVAFTTAASIQNFLTEQQDIDKENA